MVRYTQSIEDKLHANIEQECRDLGYRSIKQLTEELLRNWYASKKLEKARKNDGL